ncbi:MAG: hypothetical protein CMQ02_04835 [Gammaproteobacteria bacterium]|nr:hypothetical protein [Gammaproteobacteria bacterium]
MHIYYWYWIVFGISLMLSEIFIGSFFIFWFGASATAVGVVLILIPQLSLTTQLISWTILSLVFIVAWFKLFKPLSIDKTKAGLSREALIGEVGQIISTPTSEKNGIVRFPVPLLGANEWEVISQEELTVGDRVKVTEVSGNSLIVARA